MEDDDDVHSEHAPEGWTSIFNRVTSGQATTPPKSSRKSQENSKSESTGWFAGLFRGVTATRRSSISSYTSSRAVSGSEPDTDEDSAMKKLKLEEDENDGSESSIESGVDSDGFVIESNRERPAGASSDGSDSGVSVPELAEQEDKTSPRRERLRKQLNFTVTQTASEAALPEVASQALAKSTVPEQPKPPMSDSERGPEPISWWQTLFPTVTVPPQRPELSTESKPSEGKDEVPKNEQGETVMWGNIFGSSKTQESEARKLLPVITAPPGIDALAEANSYFTAEPSGPSAEIFGPRPLMQFSGRLRGWPKRYAPHWSSDGKIEAPKRFPTSAKVNGASALAMFRVT